ncbi:hypothetical protein [Cellulomonas sp. NPDC058312]|uniref:hypothetical protein n=1 Tax=Cellulomonas sp. NPDC058312 TaxID=3346441 RepID=UPI0036EDC9F5
MTRLPLPTITLATDGHGLLQPAPQQRQLHGIRTSSYRPVRARASVRAQSASSCATVPAGYVDAAAFAAARDWPESVVVYRALRAPEKLPVHVVVDGRPYFPVSSLPGAVVGA